MTAAIDWLPSDASLPRAAAMDFASRIETWSRRWISGAVLRPLGDFQVSPGAISLDAVGWETAGEIALGKSSASDDALGKLILGLDTVRANHADAAVASKVVASCIDDLKQVILAGLGTHQTSQWGVPTQPIGTYRYRLDIGCSSVQPRLSVALTTAGMAAAIRRALPKPVLPKLADLGAALAPVPVGVSALLGTCRLPLADVQALATGDVLLLDTAIDDALPIAIAGQWLASGQGVLDQRDGALMLNIVEPVA